MIDKLTNLLIKKRNKQLHIPVVMCRFVVSLMYDRIKKNEYVDYRIEQLIVFAENKNEAELIAIKTLENKMNKINYKLCVYTSIEII